jgi:hypothetical protein
MYVYAPALETAASTAFMVWLQTFSHPFRCAQGFSQLQILTYYKIRCGYDSVT